MATPRTMKAIVNTASRTASYTNPAPVSALILKPSLPVPIPSPTQHLLRIHATAITPYELTWAMGDVPEPRIPCHDTAGTVVSSPPDSPFKAGDRVFSLLPMIFQGGMAEYATVEPQFLAKIPEKMSFVEAASVPRASMTSWQALAVRNGGYVKKGMSVLVTGATGAVGHVGVHIARNLVGGQGKVIAVGGVGSEKLKAIGADVALNYREESSWDEIVKTQGLVDVVYDCVGGVALEKSVPLVKDGGFVVTVGSPPPEWETLKGWKEARERGVNGEFFIVEGTGKELSEIAKLWESGKVKTSVGLVVDGLTGEGVQDGWTRGLQGGLAGSVVVKIL